VSYLSTQLARPPATRAYPAGKANQQPLFTVATLLTITRSGTMTLPDGTLTE
jgi:hypothetical protein